jgi:hypothetical protein
MVAMTEAQLPFKQLLTKAEAEALATRLEALETLDITMHGVGVSLAMVVDELAELRKHGVSGTGLDQALWQEAVTELRHLMAPVLAVLTAVRRRPLPWRLIVGLLVLGLCLGSTATFWWMTAHPQVLVVQQQVPANRGK